MSYPIIDWVKQSPAWNTTGAEELTHRRGAVTDMSGNTFVTYLVRNRVVSGGDFYGGRDAVIAKFDVDGNLVWIKQTADTAGTGDEQTSILAVDNNGDIYFAVQLTSDLGFGTDYNIKHKYAILKFDTNGALLWKLNDSYAFVRNNHTFNGSLAVDNLGGLYFAVQVDSGAVSGAGAAATGNHDIAVVKINAANGTRLWTVQNNRINSTAQDSSPLLSADATGVYLCYMAQGTVSGGTRVSTGFDSPVLMKLSASDGSRMWLCQNPGINASNTMTEMAMGLDPFSNSVLLAHRANGVSSGLTATGKGDILIFKISASTGSITAATRSSVINTVDEEYRPSITADANGNIFIAYIVDRGFVGSAIGQFGYDGQTDLVVAKLDQSLNRLWAIQHPSFNAGADDQPNISVLPSGKLRIVYRTNGSVSGGTVAVGSMTNTDIAIAQFTTEGATTRILQSPAFNTRLFNSSDSTVRYDAAGNLYLAQRTNGGIVQDGTASGSEDIVISKFDPNGTFLWSKQDMSINNSAVDAPMRGYSIAVEPTSGAIYLFYDTNGAMSGGDSAGSSDVCLIKLDTDGNRLWGIQDPLLNTSGLDVNASIALDPSGNLILTYLAGAAIIDGTFVGGTGDVVVAKYDADGNKIWAMQNNQIATAGNELEPRPATDASGNIFIIYAASRAISGLTYLGGNNDTIVMKLDPNGNRLWVKSDNQINTSDTFADVDQAICVDAAGDVYITKNVNSAISGGTRIGTNEDIMVAKLSGFDGSLIWSKQDMSINTAVRDGQPTIALDGSGNLYLAYYVSRVVAGAGNEGTFTGMTASDLPATTGTTNFNGPYDIAVAKLDSATGVVQWTKQNTTFNTINSETSPNLIVSPDGSTISMSYTVQGAAPGGTSADDRGTDDIALLQISDVAISVPAAPTGVTATAGAVDSGVIDVTWTPPPMPTGVPMTYNVAWSGAVSGSISVMDVSSTTISELIGGTYSITVSAGNYAGVGVASSPASATVTETAPDAPTDLVVVVRDSGVGLSWTKPSQAVSSYTVSWSGGSKVVTNGTVTSVMGLTNGISYSFSVTATNTVSTSAAVSSDPVVPLPAPTVITNIEWLKQDLSANTPSWETMSGRGRNMVIDASGNTYYTYRTGQSYSSENTTTGNAATIPGGTILTVGASKIVVVKYDSSGSVVWAKQNPRFQTYSFDNTPSITVDPVSGIVYLAFHTDGHQLSGFSMKNTIHIYAFSSAGDVLWGGVTAMALNPFNQNDVIIKYSAGNLYILYLTSGVVAGGVTTDVTTANQDLVLARLNPADGSVIWMKQDPRFNAFGSENSPDLAVDRYGSPYIMFATLRPVSGAPALLGSGTRDVVICKFDSNGNLRWTKTDSSINTPGEDDSCTLTLDSDCNVIFAYRTNSSLSGIIRASSGTTTDLVLGKLDQNGTRMWAIQDTTLNSASGNDANPSLTTDTYGNIYVAHQPNNSVLGGSATGSEDICIQKFTTNGARAWIYQGPSFNTAAADEAPAIAVDEAGVVTVIYLTRGVVPGGTTYDTGFMRDVAILQISQTEVFAPPTLSTVTPGNGYIDVSWNAPIETYKYSSADITYYVVEVLNYYEDVATLTQVSKDQTSARLSNLTNGSTYIVRVKAISYSEDGQYSGASALTVPFTLAFAPVNVSGSPFTNGVILSWTPGNRPITSYTVFWTAPGDLSGSMTVPGASATITGLINDIPYTFEVSATNASGTSTTRSTPVVITPTTVTSRPRVDWVVQNSQFNTEATDELVGNGNACGCDASGNMVFVYHSRRGILTNGPYEHAGTTVGAVSDNHIKVVKLDPSGNLLWVKQDLTINSWAYDLNASLVVAPNGNIYIASQVGGVISGGTAAGGNDVAVMKLNPNGERQWIAQNINFLTTSNDQQPTIALDADENVVVAFQTQGTTVGNVKVGSWDLVVAKISTTGAVLWTQQNASMNSSSMTVSTPNVVLDANSNIYVAYNVDRAISDGSALVGGTDTVLMKFEPKGIRQWVVTGNTISTPGNDVNPTLIVDSFGNIFLYYFTSSTISGTASRGGNEGVLMKFDEGGNSMWAVAGIAINSTSSEANGSLSTDAEGNVYLAYIVGGSITGATTTKGGAEIAISKFNPAGVRIWTVMENRTLTSATEGNPNIAAGPNGSFRVVYRTAGAVPGGTLIANPSQDIALLTFDGNGNQTSIKMDNSINTAGTESEPTVKRDSAGNYYLMYTSTTVVSGGTYVGGSTDVVVSKFNAAGTRQWIAQNSLINTAGTDTIITPSMDIDSAGNVYIVRHVNSVLSGAGNLVGNNEIYLMKLNTTNGARMWVSQHNRVNTATSDQNACVIVDSSGSVYIAYETSGAVSGGTLVGGQDIVLLKFDTNGNRLWIMQDHRINSASSESRPSLAVDNAGFVYLAYTTGGAASGMSSRGNNDQVIVKINGTTGVTSWRQQDSSLNTGSSENTNLMIAADPVGNVYLVHNVNFTMAGAALSYGEHDIGIAKFNTSGTRQWALQSPLLNTKFREAATAVAVDSAGNLYITYRTQGVISGSSVEAAYASTLGLANQDIVVAKINTNGTIAWTRQTSAMNTIGDEENPSIAVSADGSQVFLAYSTTGTPTGGISQNTSTQDIVVASIGQVFQLNAPTDLVATAGLNNSGQIAVSWTAPTNSSVQHYTVSWTGPRSGMLERVTSSSVTITGLIPGAYTVSVRGVNEAGRGAVATATPVTLTADVPVAPTGLAGVARDSSIFLQWSVDSPVESCRIRWSTGDLSGQQIVSGGVTYATLQGLTNARAYVVTVSATRGNVESAASSPITVAPTPSPSYGSIEWIKQSPLWNNGLNEIIISHNNAGMDASGNLYVLYYTGSGSVTMTKIGPAGDFIWVKYASFFSNAGLAIDVKPDGAYYIAGGSSGAIAGATNAGSSDIIVAAYTSDGDQIWAKQHAALNTELSDDQPVISIGPTGDIYVAYRTAHIITGGVVSDTVYNSDVVVAKLAGDTGDLLWARQDPLFNYGFGPTLAVDDIIVDAEGSCYIASYGSGTISGGVASGSSDVILTKLDTNGSFQWNIQNAILNTAGDDAYCALVVDADQNIIFAYSAGGTLSGGRNLGSYDIVVSKITRTGQILWARQNPLINTNSWDSSVTVATDANCNIYIAYEETGAPQGFTHAGNGDITIVKMTTNGDREWIIQNTTMNTASGGEKSATICVGADNSLRLAYYTTGTVSGGERNVGDTNSQDVVVMKIAQVVAPPPTDLAVVAGAIDSGAATLTWTAPTTTETIAGYVVSWGSGVKTVTGTSATITGLVGGPITFTVQTLLQPQGSNLLSAIAGPVTVTIPMTAPDAPTGLTGVVGDGSLMLRWTPPPQGALSYSVTLSGTGFSRTQTAVGPVTTFFGVPNNASYTYTVIAINAGGTSAASAPSGPLIPQKSAPLTPSIAWVKQDSLVNTADAENMDQIGIPRVALDANGYLYSTYIRNVSGSGDVVVTKTDPNGAVVWSVRDTISTADNDSRSSLAYDATSNSIYVAIYTTGAVSGGTNSGAGDIAIVKLDQNGQILWTQQSAALNTPANDTSSAPAIAVDSAGNVLVLYATIGSVTGARPLDADSAGYDIVVAKLDPTGALLWVNQHPSNKADSFGDYTMNLAVDTANNVYVVYLTEGPRPSEPSLAIGSTDLAVLKLNPSGNLLWYKQDNTIATPSYDFRPAIGTDAGGNVYIASYTNGSPLSGFNTLGSNELFLLKLDTNGTRVWAQQSSAFNTSVSDVVPAIAVTPSGAFYLSFSTTGVISGGFTSAGGADLAVMKFDMNGQRLWAFQDPQFNTAGTDQYGAIAFDGAGNLYVLYETSDATSGNALVGSTDVALLKIVEVSNESAPEASIEIGPAVGSMTVSWTAAGTGSLDLSGYNLYDADTNTVLEFFLASAPRSKEFTVATKQEATNSYYVKAVLIDGGSSLESSFQSNTVSGRPLFIGAPTGVSASVGEQAMSVSWSAPDLQDVVSGDIRYSICDASGQTELATGIAGSSYTFASSLSGGTFSYTVKAYTAAGTVGPLSDPTPAVTVPAAPTVTVTERLGGIDLSWNAISGASSYEVYNGSGTLLDTVTSPSWSSGALDFMTTYTYKVRAANGFYSDVVSGRPYGIATPAAPTLTPARDQITVAWVAPSSYGITITGYRITMDISGGATSTVDVSGLSRVFTGLDFQKVYTYKVRALYGASSTEDSATASTSPFGVTEPVVSGTRAHNAVNLQWSAVTFTTSVFSLQSYEIYVGGAYNSAVSGLSASPSATGSTTYQIRAKFEYISGTLTGQTFTSDSKTITVTPFTAPSVPQNLSLLAGSAGTGTVTASWSAPADFGGPAAITVYRISWTDGKGVSGSVDVSGTVTTRVVTGLNGGTFPVSVKAYNGYIYSADVSGSVSLITAPNAPSSLTATRSATLGQATVSWVNPTYTGGAALTATRVRWDISGTDVSGSVDVSGASTTLTGLSAGTLRVWAKSYNGSVYSAETGPATTAIYGKSDAPTSVGVTAGAANSGAATVSWTAPVNKGGAASIVTYTVRWVDGSGGIGSKDVSGTSLSTSLSGLSVGVVQVWVKAYNGYFTSDESGAATATLLGTPGAPTGLTLSAGSVGVVNVSWTAPVYKGGAASITSYTVRWQDGKGVTGSTIVSSGTSTQLSGLKGGLVTVWVKAYNGGADSSETQNTITIATIPDAPTGATVTAGAYGAATVSWTAPVYTAGAASLKYSLTWSGVGGVSGSDTNISGTSYALTDLYNGTLSATVTAYNAADASLISAGVDASGSVVGTLLAPGTPGSFVVGNHGSGQVTASWAAPSNGTPTFYDISWNNTNTTVSPDVSSGSASYTFTGITGGTTTVQVRAYNGGYSAWSEVGTLSIPSDVSFNALFPGATPASGFVRHTFVAPGGDLFVFLRTSSTQELIYLLYKQDASTNLISSTYITSMTGVDISDGSLVGVVDDNTLTLPAGPTEATLLRSNFTLSGLVAGTYVLIAKTTANDAGEDVGISIKTSAYVDVPLTDMSGNTDLAPLIRNAPGGVTATGGAYSAAVSWSAPVFVKSYPSLVVSGYRYKVMEGATVKTEADVASSPATITGLSGEVQYTVQVAAYYDGTLGPYSEAASFTPYQIPGAPAGITVTPGNATLGVSYNAATSTGGSVITEYQYSLNGTTWTSASSSPFSIDASNGVAYTVYLRAVNAAGAGASVSATATPRTTPDAPSLDLSAGTNYIRVTYGAPVFNGGANISGYEYKLGVGAWTLASASPFDISGLQPNTSYTVYLRAVNVAGTGAEASASVTTRSSNEEYNGGGGGGGDQENEPSVAAPVVIATSNDGYMLLSWAAPATVNATITGYRVTRSDATTWDISGRRFKALPSSTFDTYSYSVAALAGALVGDQSNSVPVAVNVVHELFIKQGAQSAFVLSYKGADTVPFGKSYEIEFPSLSNLVPKYWSIVEGANDTPIAYVDFTTNASGYPIMKNKEDESFTPGYTVDISSSDILLNGPVRMELKRISPTELHVQFAAGSASLIYTITGGSFSPNVKFKMVLPSVSTPILIDYRDVTLLAAPLPYIYASVVEIDQGAGLKPYIFHSNNGRTVAGSALLDVSENVVMRFNGSMLVGQCEADAGTMFYSTDGQTFTILDMSGVVPNPAPTEYLVWSILDMAWYAIVEGDNAAYYLLKSVNGSTWTEVGTVSMGSFTDIAEFSATNTGLFILLKKAAGFGSVKYEDGIWSVPSDLSGNSVYATTGTHYYVRPQGAMDEYSIAAARGSTRVFVGLDNSGGFGIPIAYVSTDSGVTWTGHQLPLKTIVLGQDTVFYSSDGTTHMFAIAAAPSSRPGYNMVYTTNFVTYQHSTSLEAALYSGSFGEIEHLTWDGQLWNLYLLADFNKAELFTSGSGNVWAQTGLCIEDILGVASSSAMVLNYPVNLQLATQYTALIGMVNTTLIGSEYDSLIDDEDKIKAALYAVATSSSNANTDAILGAALPSSGAELVTPVTVEYPTVDVGSGGVVAVRYAGVIAGATSLAAEANIATPPAVPLTITNSSYPDEAVAIDYYSPGSITVTNVCLVVAQKSLETGISRISISSKKFDITNTPDYGDNVDTVIFRCPKTYGSLLSLTHTSDEGGVTPITATPIDLEALNIGVVTVLNATQRASIKRLADVSGQYRLQYTGPFSTTEVELKTAFHALSVVHVRDGSDNPFSSMPVPLVAGDKLRYVLDQAPVDAVVRFSTNADAVVVTGLSGEYTLDATRIAALGTGSLIATISAVYADGTAYSLGSLTVLPAGAVKSGNTVTLTKSLATGGGGGAIPCIVKGQRILTPTGYRRVEELRQGDLIKTADGRPVRVKVYSTTVEKTTKATAPVRIGALRISPNHAFKVNKHGWQFPSIAVEYGLAGAVQEAPGARMVYYHVETPNYLTDNLVVEGREIESLGANFVMANKIDPTKIYTLSKAGPWFYRRSQSSAKPLNI